MFFIVYIFPFYVFCITISYEFVMFFIVIFVPFYIFYVLLFHIDF